MDERSLSTMLTFVASLKIPIPGSVWSADIDWIELVSKITKIIPNSGMRNFNTENIKSRYR